MDFTREPIIETIITPKEGSKLVVRSSKSNGQEEHFVDAIEVVSFGHSFFFRSLERPKTFLVPATDYEILEVREARMVLKNVGIDRAIKIAGGREAPMRQRESQKDAGREASSEKTQSSPEEVVSEPQEEQTAASPTTEKTQEGRLDKKRDRRRGYRRRGRGREGSEEDTAEGEAAELKKGADAENAPLAQQVMTTSILTSLLPPPSTLISETIAHYKDKFKEAFYPKGEERKNESDEDKDEGRLAGGDEEQLSTLSREESVKNVPFELSDEDEENMYHQRKLQSTENFDDESDLPIHHHDKSLPEEPREPFEKESNPDSFSKE